MGLGFLQLVRQIGPAALAGFDPLEGGRDLALSLGATETYDPADAATATLRYDVVIEAAGTASALTLGGKLVAQHGTLVVVGYHNGPREADPELWYKGVTVVNGYTPRRANLVRAMAEGLALIAERRFSYEPLITHRFGLDEVDAGFGLFQRRPAGFVKSVVMP
jgi:threonine dehydrogenase-like Zn-dependent dehydrogenase